MKNRLVTLHDYGQSFWYDMISRQQLQDGTVLRLINEDGLRGMTSNPSIFDKAISHSDKYDQQLAELADVGVTGMVAFEDLARDDIRAACDLFAPVYKSSGGHDGFVSLEVSPYLANDTHGTIAEARRLFDAVDRENVMIKVPSTPAGIPAIRQLTSEGINVNITLMFSMEHYEAVANAYIEGASNFLVSGAAKKMPVSVASFFVSRVDSAVDKQLKALGTPAAEKLLGQAAIANSRLVYQRYKEIFVAEGGPFSYLRSSGVPVQRLLWASTSTKDPAYKDTMYIDELIGPDTISTIPPATIEAFLDHGTLGNTLETNVAESHAVMIGLAALGIDVSAVANELLEQGVAAFAHSFDSLLGSINTKQAALAQT